MINAEKFWDKTAENYAKSAIDDMEGYTFTLDRTRSHLSKTDTVLELGCGTGSTALLLAKDVKRIVASDVSGNMIKIGQEKAAQQGVPNISFVNADMSDTVLDDTLYDAVLAFNLLHLLEDVPAAINKIHGLLKPNGIFISKTFCQFGKSTPIKYRVMKAVLPIMQKFGKAPYVNFMGASVLDEMITSGGFKVIETGDHPSHYVVAKKI